MPLTNLADAYLIDHSVVDRVVVVATLGELGNPNATMNGPNGDLDPWAGWIVAQKYRYVQVSAYYDQTGDVLDADLNRLAAERARRLDDGTSSPRFTRSRRRPIRSRCWPWRCRSSWSRVQRSSPDTSVAFDDMQGPPLRPDDAGNAWVVTKIDAPLAATHLWEMLTNPTTFGS